MQSQVQEAALGTVVVQHTAASADLATPGAAQVVADTASMQGLEVGPGRAAACVHLVEQVVAGRQSLVVAADVDTVVLDLCMVSSGSRQAAAWVAAVEQGIAAAACRCWGDLPWKDDVRVSNADGAVDRAVEEPC